jgi:hypothetical protein
MTKSFGGKQKQSKTRQRTIPSIPSLCCHFSLSKHKEDSQIVSQTWHPVDSVTFPILEVGW